jgi:hypothetical protein
MVAFVILKCSGPNLPVGFSTKRIWRLTVSVMAFSPLGLLVLVAFQMQFQTWLTGSDCNRPRMRRSMAHIVRCIER